MITATQLDITVNAVIRFVAVLLVKAVRRSVVFPNRWQVKCMATRPRIFSHRQLIVQNRFPAEAVSVARRI
jgi:hypothetical protein